MPIMRSPKDTADKIAHLIQGKVFCDLGCAKGGVVIAARKYARHSFGIERSKDAIASARAAGAEVIEGDVMLMDLPQADVYYSWITHDMQRQLHGRWYRGDISGILVIGAEKFVKEEWAVFDELAPDEVIQWEYDEGPGHRDRGTFKLGIFYARSNLR